MKDIHETERYTTIDAFPDYQITSYGRVLSLKHGKLKELKQRKNNWQYYYVNLWKNGKMFSKTVHRLVAQAFIPNPEHKAQVNHIDEDVTNNHISNLEWVTSKENLNHGTRNERASKTMSDGRRKGFKHTRARAVIGFKINGCDIKYYKYINECKKDGFIQSGIVQCCRNRQKSHKGYNWYYADEFFNRKD